MNPSTKNSFYYEPEVTRVNGDLVYCSGCRAWITKLDIDDEGICFNCGDEVE